MANEVKDLYQTSAAITITVAGLATSSAATPGLWSGREGTIVTNIDGSGRCRRKGRIYTKITTGTSPTANTSIIFFLMVKDQNGTPFITDGASGSDANFAGFCNADIVATIAVPYNTSNQAYYKTFIIENVPPYWSIGVAQTTGVNLNATAANHYIRYELFDEEIQ